jgi:N-acetyl-anhydromuramyl-L-alanine amidase AmpD
MKTPKDKMPEKENRFKKLDLSKIVQHNFSEKHYFAEELPKKQIVIHHTVSPESVKGDVNWWLNDGKRIGTCVLVAHDGTVHQVFSSKYWAYHLGLPNKHFSRQNLPYKKLDPISIGIEIDSFGGLKKGKNGWESVYGNPVPDEKVVEYPDGYRGYYAFEKYTNDQIEAVRQLLVFWNEKYDIPLDYNEDMWEVSKRALKGEPGVWSHTSYRYDKSDIHPQAELIEMLKSLT